MAHSMEQNIDSINKYTYSLNSMYVRTHDNPIALALR